MTRNDVIVLFSAISPYGAVRGVRGRIGNLLEVYVNESRLAPDVERHTGARDLGGEHPASWSDQLDNAQPFALNASGTYLPGLIAYGELLVALCHNYTAFGSIREDLQTGEASRIQNCRTAPP